MGLKYVEEYRDGELAKGLIDKIASTSRKPVRLMEVCGTHTMSIFRHGIRSVLPDTISLLSGPGCPVCVTAQKDIDGFIALSKQDNMIITTFGDLVKVPGSNSSLAMEKAAGADVRIVYSVSDALEIAQKTPDKEVVFCAVGFETTIPTIAAVIMAAMAQQVTNFSIYSANKLTPPALAALMETDGVQVDGFILPGHVSVITGTNAYRSVFDRYHVPCVIAGFEPVDILDAIARLVHQNETGRIALENAYTRAVSDAGNTRAQSVMCQVFEPCPAAWRGIGDIPESGMGLKNEYSSYNAALKFNIDMPNVPEPAGCACGEILMGKKTPKECALYRRKCTPMNPVGPCMVSSEGACAAFYRYSGVPAT